MGGPDGGSVREEAARRSASSPKQLGSRSDDLRHMFMTDLYPIHTAIVSFGGTRRRKVSLPAMLRRLPWSLPLLCSFLPTLPPFPFEHVAYAAITVKYVRRKYVLPYVEVFHRNC